MGDSSVKKVKSKTKSCNPKKEKSTARDKTSGVKIPKKKKPLAKSKQQLLLANSDADANNPDLNTTDDVLDSSELEQDSSKLEQDDLFNFKNKFGVAETITDDFELSMPHINLQYMIVDEICLEGLDGITLNALWLRISVAIKQPLPLPRHVMRYIWNIIRSRQDIEFYQLPSPREELVLFDRFQNIDPDLGVAVEPIEVQPDIYPYYQIKENDILGSAVSFKIRKNVTDEVRKLTMNKVVKEYGSSLVIVGKQKMRFKVLTHALVDPKIELTAPQYCVLERIGRSRYHGETTQGKVSLQIISKDPKILFYNRKILMEHSLITKQSFFVKTPPVHQTTSSLLHLTRFYNEKKSKTQIMTEQIVEVLRHKPFHRMEYQEVKKTFGNSTALNKLFKMPEFQKFVKTDVQCRYRDIRPNAPETEWKQKGSGKEKVIRTIELVNPNINVSGAWNEEETKEESSDEEESNQLIFNSSILHQMYEYIRLAGPDGLSLKELQANTGLDFYSVRASVNKLVSYNFVVGVKLDVGRQRLMKYHILNSGESENTALREESSNNSDIEKASLEHLSGLLDVDAEFLALPRILTEPETNALDENLSANNTYALIKKLRKEMQSNKSEIRDKNNMGYKGKGGESLLRQLLSHKEKLNVDSTSGLVDESNIVVENIDADYADDISHRDINFTMLEHIFTNQHEYQSAKNNLTPDIIEVKEDLKKLWQEVCHSQEFLNNTQVKKKKTYKKLITKMQLESSQKFLKQQSLLFNNISKNMVCPLTFLSLKLLPSKNQYKRWVNKMLKIVKPILSHLKYEVKVLKPKKRYMCKQKISRKKILAFANDHPLLTLHYESHNLESNFDNISNLSEKKRKAVDAISFKAAKRMRLFESPLFASSPEIPNLSAPAGIFMGPKPTLAYKTVDEDDIEISVFVSTKPEDFDDTEYRYIRDDNATLRTLKRASCVVEAVRQEKIITDIRRLHKAIETQDNEEGYNVKIDKKSIDRIYTRLVRGGYIKILQIVLKGGNVQRNVTVVCDTSIDEDHSLVVSVIEQMKMKCFISSKKKSWECGSETIPEKAFYSSNITNSLGELQQLTNNDSPPYEYNRSIGKDYGHAPKFMRMHLLHEFLFYLIYGYPFGQEVDDVEQMFHSLNITVEPEVMQELPHIYCREVSWKMFVPALPEHLGWPDGWALMCDILLRLPLSLFVKLHNVSYNIPELPSYLEHPIKQHYLVKFLPTNIRNGLLYHRKYIYSIHDSLVRLCFIGVLQFGPQKLKEKDKLFIFLNRHATLLDTTTSNAGYHLIEDKEYKQLPYYFETLQDVESYWYEMWNICVHSHLGLRNTVMGTYITIEQAETKPAMIEAMKPKAPEVAPRDDNGFVPGDRRGAAGLDSALWSHIKRNWIWCSIGKARKKNTTDKHKDNTAKTSHIKAKKGKSKTVADENPKQSSQHQVVKCYGKKSRKKLLVNSKKSKASSDGNKRGKYIIREVLPRFESKKKKGYDIIDKTLMAHLKCTRSEWDSEEDKILRICKIVATFLCPNSRKQNIPHTVIRDTLHRISPSSSNKTSTACQRRLLVIFGNNEQQNFLPQIVRSLHLNPFVCKYISKFFETIGTKQITEKQLYGIFVILVIHFFKNQHEIHHMFEAITYKYQKASDRIAHYSTREELRATSENSTAYDLTEEHLRDQSIEEISYECIKFEEKSKANKLYPDSVENPKNERDVALDTIKSIIHSNIGSRQEEVNWIYQLFRVYQRYSDELLKAGLNEIHNAQMVSIKRLCTKKSAGLPITTKLFQFSFYYYFSQITNFPYEIFTESHEILLGMAKFSENLHDIPEKGLPLECFEQGHSVGLAEISVHLQTHFDIDIPKEVLLLNPNITDHTELIRELAVRYKNMLTLVKKGTYFKDDENEIDGNQFLNDGAASDQVDLGKQEKTRIFPAPRAPMIQRFLKSWFLGDDDDDVDESRKDATCESLSGKIQEDKRIVSKVDKKRKHPKQIMSEQSKIILESLNPTVFLKMGEKQTNKLMTCSSQERGINTEKTNAHNNVDMLNSIAESHLTFEEYEKKLENLLITDNSSEILNANQAEVSVDSEIATTDEVQDVPSVVADFSDSDTSILEKYLTIKRNLTVTPPSSVDVVDFPVPEKVKNSEIISKNTESVESDIDTNARIQYLLNDELTVEQIMEEMLKDCPPEQRKVPKPINLARLLVKGLLPEMDDDEERLERLHRHFVIVCPDINLKLSNALENEEFSYLYMVHPQTCKNLLKKVQKDIIVSDKVASTEELEIKLKSMGVKQSEIQVAENLIRFVYKRRVLGATVKQLKANFANLENLKLPTLLNILSEMNILLRVGITSIIYVHHKFMKQWVVESGTLTDQDRLKLKETEAEESATVDLSIVAKSLESYTEITLKITPWARIDGTLNLKIFEKWLCVILGFCLSNQMMPLKKLFNLCCYLKPVDVYYLVECLQELGCVQMIAFEVPTSTLFSSTYYIKSVPAEITDEFENIFIESDTLAVIKLGTLLNKKLKAHDFKDDESRAYETF